MDCRTASSPSEDITMSSSVHPHHSFADDSSQESVSMQCCLAPNSLEAENNVVDAVEERGDPILPSPLAVKIADLGNACWVVSHITQVNG